MEAQGQRESLSLITALNRDALEEVLVHCSPTDLLALRATCSATARLLDASERVWLAKLRETFSLNLKSLVAAEDGLFVRLARRTFEASRSQQLRFQGVFVNGGVDEDAMHYFVDNLFRPDKAPYCSNCSHNADCIALMLDGEVPRDVEYARVRQYMIRRCRYAAALILNVQMPAHGRDPDDIMHILEDWTDMQLEGFFKDLVNAMQAEHALGRLLVFDIPHDRMAAEEQKILAVHQWLLDRPGVMKAAMLKPPGDANIMFDTDVVPKLTGGAGRRLAGVVHEVSLSRAGTLTCPVAAGAVLLGSLDHSKVAGWAAEEILALLQRASTEPACTALNGMHEVGEVQRAAALGLLPPIVATDQTVAGVWHEFDTSPDAAAKQAEAAAAAAVQTSRRDSVLAVSSANSAEQQTVAGSSREAAAAEPAAEGDAGSSQAQQPEVSPAGIVCWKPLLWFKFHSAEEATTFVQRYRQLIDQYGSQATVRHQGPPPTRSHHVPAPAGQPLQLQHHQPVAGAAALLPNDQWLIAQAQQGPGQVQQQQQHMAPPAPHPDAQQQGPALQHNQQAVAIGMPAAWQPHQQGAAVADGVPVPAGYGLLGAGAPGMVAAAGAGGAAAVLQAAAAAADGPDDEDEESSEGNDEEAGGNGANVDMDDSDSEGSDSEMDEAAEAPGAWLQHWAQDEFGADLQQEQDVVVAGEGLPFDQMDEGSSSEEDEEGALEEHFDLAPVAGAGAAGAPPAGAVPLAQQGGAHASAADTLLRTVSRRNTRARSRLRVPLSRPVGANMLLVKLINQENLMEQYGDPHSWPNIDMTFCGLFGRQVELPSGVVLAAP